MTDGQDEIDADTACCKECGAINVGFYLDELVQCGCPSCGSHDLMTYQEYSDDFDDYLREIGG
ncbi:hypothetical protein [Comamonas sp. wu1-DMT]|uniref:hypothetical protein n=1 Tax=Comamonas sp. wu1-DMT TaxID=3126390 RepID=UPI0032E4C073